MGAEGNERMTVQMFPALPMTKNVRCLGKSQKHKISLDYFEQGIDQKLLLLRKRIK